MAAIEIKVKPTLRALRGRVTRARKMLGNMKKPHHAIAVFLDQWVQRNFRSEGGSVGGWVPLALSTRIARIRKTLRSSGRGRNVRGRRTAVPLSAARMQILQDTGRLRASMLPFANSREAGIGSQLPYAKTHEKGKGKTPQRRILPKQGEVRGAVQSILNLHVKSALRGAGLK